MDRHVILTLGRSGSNTLVNTINQHPELLNIGEVLGDWNRIRQVQRKLGLYGSDTARYLDATTTRSPLVRFMSAGRSAGRLARGRFGELKPLHRIQSLGIKEFATLMSKHGVADYLTERTDIKVIGLVRDDVLDRLVSYLRLRQTGEVLAHSTQSGSGENRLSVDPEEFLSLLENIDTENKMLKQMLDALPESRRRIIRYDAFYKDEPSRQHIMEEVFAFLGVPAVQTRSRMKKIITTTARDMLENRHACACALQGTRFEGMLE